MAQGKVVFEMRGVVKRFRAGVRGCSASVLALDGFDLIVRAGERVGVLGPAGSGKSTLILCAAGLARPDEGVVRWRGSARLADHRGIALADDREALYAFLTVRETLDHYLTRHDLESVDRDTLVTRAIAMTGLAAAADCRLSLLPNGTRRRVSLAQAMLMDPWLLLVDGTIDALPRADAATVRAALVSVAAKGCAVVVSSRDAGALAGMVTRVVAIRAPGSVGESITRIVTRQEADDGARSRLALVRERDNSERR